jgi:hypothetical protein
MDAIEAAEKIRNGKLRTGTYDICLDETLVEEYETLRQERDTAKDATRDSLAGGQVVELDKQLGDLLERIQEATITLTFKAFSRPRFRELCDAYPPRTDEDGKVTDQTDAVYGVNYDAFMERVIPLALVDPKLDEKTLKVLLEEQVNDRTYYELCNVVWGLNRTKVDLSFVSAASTKTRTSSVK